MGRELTNEGIKIDQQKAKAILEMPKPSNVEEVQRLNGFVDYLAKFLPKTRCELGANTSTHPQE